jgi:hypothetical protein
MSLEEQVVVLGTGKGQSGQCWQCCYGSSRTNKVPLGKHLGDQRAA